MKRDIPLVCAHHREWASRQRRPRQPGGCDPNVSRSRSSCFVGPSLLDCELNTCLVQGICPATHGETKSVYHARFVGIAWTGGLSAAQGWNIALDKSGLIRVRLQSNWSQLR